MIKIHNRLKVMFGHPRNTKMLRDLEQDYQEINEDNQQRFAGIIPPHKEYLEEVYDLLTSKLNEVHKTFSIIKDDRITNVIEELTTQLNIKSELLRPIVYTNMAEGASEVFVNNDTAHYIQNYFKESTTYLGLEPYSFQALSINTLSTDKTFETLEDFFNVLRETITATTSAIQIFVNNKIIKANDDFKQTWAEDIKYILNLYKVKYDNKIF
ncbi:uncharacterized protein LOC130452770 [Diorhabda sublineata]|uniref:uncharacterized protein LOC130452770 n=1 Tax=Diorhabda sublineata TaxID=1163346 RepID=UPI0024E19612|nr:uncharacterized protein LOC130452770 [Diorhabda sublineata]